MLKTKPDYGRSIWRLSRTWRLLTPIPGQTLRTHRWCRRPLLRKHRRCCSFFLCIALSCSFSIAFCNGFRASWQQWVQMGQNISAMNSDLQWVQIDGANISAMGSDLLWVQIDGANMSAMGSDQQWVQSVMKERWKAVCVHDNVIWNFKNCSILTRSSLSLLGRRV